MDIYAQIMESDADPAVKSDAIDNLLLFIQKIIKDAGSEIERFLPEVEKTFHYLRSLPDDLFNVFVRSYYPINRLAENFLNGTHQSNLHFRPLNLLLIKYFQYTYDYWLTEGDPQSWFAKESAEIDSTDNFEVFFKNISHFPSHFIMITIKSWMIHCISSSLKLP